MTRTTSKNASVRGMTKKGRLTDLEKKKKTMLGKGWTFIEYHDGGLSKSFARFEKSVSGGSSLGKVVALWFVGMVLASVLYSMCSGRSPRGSAPATSNTPAVAEGAQRNTPAASVAGESIQDIGARAAPEVDAPLADVIPQEVPGLNVADDGEDTLRVQTIPSEGTVCSAGEECKVWYVLHDVESTGVIIKSSKAPVVAKPVYAVSAEQMALADALEEEVFDPRYEFMDDDKMIRQISKSWGEPVELLEWLGVARMVVQKFLKEGKFKDLRGQSSLQSEEVRVEAKVLVGLGQKPRLVGTTNLPDGTSLMVTVQDKLGGYYRAQSTMEVKFGYFVVGPFTAKGAALREGEYLADLTMPSPSVQSPRVREVIGQKGENLRGESVSEGKLGVTVEASVPFFVGPSIKTAVRADKKRTADTEEERKRILKEATALEKKGREMDPLRRTDDPEKLGQCGELMRMHQKKSHQLLVDVEVLPLLERIHLRSGLVYLDACVSCTRDDSDSCDKVRVALETLQGE
jgi:hypothetical protein